MSQPSRRTPLIEHPRKRVKLGFALAVFGSGLVMVGGPPQVAHATSLTVNTAEDIGPDALTGRFPTDGKCSSAGGHPRRRVELELA